jgi:hypothetical protein
MSIFTARCFCVVQKQKGVAGAVIEAGISNAILPVPSGMHPLGCGGHRTPPQLLTGGLAVRPAGSQQAAGLGRPGTPGAG